MLTRKRSQVQTLSRPPLFSQVRALRAPRRSGPLPAWAAVGPRALLAVEPNGPRRAGETRLPAITTTTHRSHHLRFSPRRGRPPSQQHCGRSRRPSASHDSGQVRGRHLPWPSTASARCDRASPDLGRRPGRSRTRRATTPKSAVPTVGADPGTDALHEPPPCGQGGRGRTDTDGRTRDTRHRTRGHRTRTVDERPSKPSDILEHHDHEDGPPGRRTPSLWRRRLRLGNQ